MVVYKHRGQNGIHTSVLTNTYLTLPRWILKVVMLYKGEYNRCTLTTLQPTPTDYYSCSGRFWFIYSYIYYLRTSQKITKRLSSYRRVCVCVCVAFLLEAVITYSSPHVFLPSPFSFLTHTCFSCRAKLPVAATNSPRRSKNHTHTHTHTLQKLVCRSPSSSRGCRHSLNPPTLSLSLSLSLINTHY